MAKNNIYGLVWNASHAAAVNQQEHEDAEMLVAVFLSEKVRGFDMLDEKEQARKLQKAPNYKHEVGLLETVMIDGTPETLNERFIEMAENAGNKWVRDGNAKAIKHLCYRHSLSQAAAQWHETPNGERTGFRYPVFTVMNEEYNSVFIETSTFTVAYLKERKPASVNDLLNRFKNRTVTNAKQAPITPAAIKAVAKAVELDKQDKAHAKLEAKESKQQAEMTRLLAENALLKAEQAAKAAAAAPKVEATIPAPVVSPTIQ